MNRNLFHLLRNYRLSRSKLASWNPGKQFVASALAALSVLGLAFAALGGNTKSPQAGPVYLVAIVVPELEPSVHWYEKHLGFRRQETILLPEVKIAFLVLNQFRMEIVEDKRALTLNALDKRVSGIAKLDNPLVGFSKLAFYVNDLDAFAARLKAEDVKFQTGIMKAEGSWPRSFIVLDSDNNWIQLVESGTDSGK